MDSAATAGPGTDGTPAGRSRTLTPLRSGAYAVLLTDAGAGSSSLGSLAVTRWRADWTRESDGLFVYVRDLESRACWSAGLQPTMATPESYTVRRAPDAVEIGRVDHGIAVTVTVRLAPEGDAELRRIAITNRSDRPRRLDVTSYGEVVLNPAAADTAHPAFSKLFVQTEFASKWEALFANRRARSPEDPAPWLVHMLQVSSGEPGGVEYETDRARFIGRGRSLSAPQAMDGAGPLDGTTGNVLDPVVSLRRVISVLPGETVHLTAVLGAGGGREAVTAIAERYADGVAADALFAVTPAFGAPVSLAGDGAAHDARDVPIAAAPAQQPVTSADMAAAPHDARAPRELLQSDNGYGGFSADGREYVIRLPASPAGPVRPPVPWTNVIANESIGFLVSESGAGHTWSANSRENRLTSWYNDPVSDTHAEALYVRDDDAGVFWSPTPGPVPGDGAYEVRHGWGYTRFLHTSAELQQEVVQFVPRHDSVKLVHVRLTNTSARTRRLSVFSFAEVVLGDTLESSGRHVVSEVDSGVGAARRALLFRNPMRGEFAGRVAFASAFASAQGPDGNTVGLSGDRAAFLGPHGSAERPRALSHGTVLDERTGAGLDPCAAVQVTVAIEPGATVDVVFLLGETESADDARALMARYASVAAVRDALQVVQGFWRDLVGGVQVRTPAPAIDLLVNGWLAYQGLCCRMWARTAFYQSGGAFGFRDQLQDSSAFVYLDASITRRQIVLHAAHQFVEGDVLHWWHPPLSKGIRTRFADDLLWLPYIAAFYVRSTGDTTVLDEVARFVAARALEHGEDEAFLQPDDSGQSADVYEHCCRALDRSLTRGAHGLPLMGTGDWNDGMNRVGREGRGESVWLGFFLHTILDDFLAYIEHRGDSARAARYRAYQTELAAALNDTGWDGAWYRRAYYDNGAPLGTSAGDECRIDAIAQAWAVISRVAPAGRAAQALDALETHLVDERHGIIRLLTPAFDRTPHDPGYIKGYLPGVRENGGQYTHGALWAVRAMAEAGRTDRAARLLEMLSPVSHTRSRADVDTYKAEPYVIAADVYGVAPHDGRGGWTWYTGSAGWYFRVALESVLGVTLVDGRALAIAPCIPDDWPGFTLRYQVPGGATVYEIDVVRSSDLAARSLSGTLDGHTLVAEAGRVLVPIVNDGKVHAVRVALG
ncbi:MAG: glycosyl transferase [Gemmatimonadota bacterium]